MSEHVPMDLEVKEMAFRRIIKYVKQSKLQRTVISILSMTEVDKEELKKLELLFRHFDTA